jgi:hypothetical protein
MLKTPMSKNSVLLILGLAVVASGGAQPPSDSSLPRAIPYKMVAHEYKIARNYRGWGYGLLVGGLALGTTVGIINYGGRSTPVLDAMYTLAMLSSIPCFVLARKHTRRALFLPYLGLPPSQSQQKGQSASAGISIQLLLN